MINLRKEILDALGNKAYMSLRQISNKVKIEPCFVLDAIAEEPTIKECGKYFDVSTNEIGKYYTVGTAELSEIIEQKEKPKQVSRMVQQLQGEISAHSGNKYPVNEAYKVIKNQDAPKVVADYFLLNKADVLYCYEVALGIRSLALNETVPSNYQRAMSIAA